MRLAIIGPSGCGKSFIASYLKENGFVGYVTHTTRPMRVGEIQDVSYHFVDIDTFMKTKTIESNEYPAGSGKYYGLSVKEVEEKSDKNVVAVLDINGAMALKKAFPDTKIVFVWAPIELLEERMRSRGDSEESIKERLENVTKSREYENCKYADYILNNIDIESARADILSYINN